MYINIDLLKREREVRNWTQQQLAEICDLSLRTIQRIEKNGIASKESIAALAAAFNMDASLLLYAESQAGDSGKRMPAEVSIRFLSGLQAFYRHFLVTFSVVLLALGVVGLILADLDSNIWLLISGIFSAGVLLTVSIMRRPPG